MQQEEPSYTRNEKLADKKLARGNKLWAACLFLLVCCIPDTFRLAYIGAAARPFRQLSEGREIRAQATRLIVLVPPQAATIL